MTQVVFRSGTYRNQDVAGLKFTLLRDYQTDARGGNVVVANEGTFPGMPEQIRVRVSSLDDIQVVSGERVENTVKFEKRAEQPMESDEDIMTRIRERFDILTEMTKACISGDIRAMIVSGPPGVGKSFGIEQEVEKAQLFDTVANKRLRVQVVKGSATPIGLYQTLYHHSDANCMLVFDDCDSILLDDVSLNLLKGALDSGKKRTISWLSESSALRREGIPDRFEFKGSVIFITNLKFDQMKSQKLRDHLDALQSRCHYLDLTLDTMRDKILRIRQIAQDGMLFQNYDFTESEQEEIVQFMAKNQNRLREMSLRMALKIADLRKLSAERWTRLAETTCMKVGG
jgi:hypothetical protein